VRRMIVGLAASVAVLVAVPAVATAAVTIGSAAGKEAYSQPSPIYTFQTTSPDDISYAVPPGGGVITSWSAYLWNADPVTFKLKVLRGDTVVAQGPALSPGSDRQLMTFPARVPVQGGDVLGIYTPPGGHAFFAYADATVSHGYGDPAVGTHASSMTTMPGYRLLLSAVVEPDADGDGHGDESQDACPADPTRQAAPCVADLRAAVTIRDSRILLGGTTVVSAGASAAAPAGVRGATLALTLPPGIELVSAGDPSCSGAPVVTCSLGDLAAGAAKSVDLVVRGRTAGPKAFSVTAAGSAAEQNPADNTASASLDVSAGCNVPRVVGRTLAWAKARLAAAGCKTGKISKPKRAKARKLRVRRQAIAAGTRVATGTKVRLTLAVPRKR
jgi:Domain of unknown function DUF11/PASTA domain